ncbi:MAG TPA: ornithine cyclodeaminase family protein [Blastocatellia bacterium]|nr:ornithine cyclodeaminase family protein [Blastocatellia bacterium]
MPEPLWISESDVVSLVNLIDAIDALERGLLREAEGKARNMLKTHVAWGGSTLHALGAVFPDDGFAGTKTWAHTEGGATPLLILLDSNSGELKAIIEAFALGQMRTAAASAVATRWLAAEGADELAIIGTGKQASSQVAAVMAVRPIKRVRVFSRDPERRAAFALRVNEEFQTTAITASSIAEAVDAAKIITVVTRAAEPILHAEMIAPGAHVNAIGAIVPSKAEIARNVLSRCNQIVVDSVPSAQKLAKELIDYLGACQTNWRRVRSLAEVVSAGLRRDSGDDITLFKSLGMGISDLALGIELYRKAAQAGVGRNFPHPRKVAPALTIAERN